MADSIGSVTVAVIPDVSQMEPAILAELDRIGAAIGQVDIADLAAALDVAAELIGGCALPGSTGIAESLLNQFVIMPRAKEPDADES